MIKWEKVNRQGWAKITSAVDTNFTRIETK